MKAKEAQQHRQQEDENKHLKEIVTEQQPGIKDAIRIPELTAGSNAVSLTAN
jgi:hypothetical protein